MMLRLANRLLWQNVKCPDVFPAAERLYEATRRIVKNAPTVIADDVYAYYTQEIITGHARHPHLAAPVFDSCLIEFAEGSSLYGSVCEFAKGDDQCSKWTLDKVIYCYRPWDDPNACYLCGLLRMYVASDGTITKAVRPNISELKGDWLPELCGAIGDVTTLVLSFLSCKRGVKSIDAPTAGPPAKWCRRLRQPEIWFKRLEIDGFKRGPKSSAGEPTGTNKAFHLCRGSFAHYTADRPLFGRYAGTVWRPAHVRGSHECGQVVKEYSVKV